MGIDGQDGERHALLRLARYLQFFALPSGGEKVFRRNEVVSGKVDDEVWLKIIYNYEW